MSVFAGLYYAARVSVVSAFQDDACLVISNAVAEMVEQGTPISAENLNATVSGLIRASVINARIDDDGTPTDYNGNPFQIVVANESVTTSTKRSILHPLESHATSLIDG